MPRRKTAKIQTKAKSVTKAVRVNASYFDYFRFGESYTSLILGMVVVIFAALILTSLFKNSNIFRASDTLKTDTSSTSTSREAELASSDTYVVAKGDTLWSIAEKNYRSGYNWVDIAEANKIINADSIHAGQKLTLPKVEAKEITFFDHNEQHFSSDSVIAGTSYQVVEGDSLWNIAERAYGDGFQWVKLAKANAIANPNIIYPQVSIQIPR
jgi:nucleoid-associated protein YgaU